MIPDTLAPLDDPAYQPQHPPVNGLVPDVVARFGPRTQVRWFDRFRRDLAHQDFSGYYYESLHHTGPCCGACFGEYEDGWQGGGVIMDGWCCCRDGRIASGGA